MLITSRRRQHWTIPKGFVKTGLSAIASAREEAWEEAGIHGIVSQVPIGRYVYTKRALLLSVTVFSMQVQKTYEVWPEAQRQRHWISLVESIAIIKESGLREMIDKFAVALTENPLDC